MTDTENAPPLPTPTDFLGGDGEMAEIYRRFDWTATPLGPPRTWPQTLRTVVRLMLNTKHPMFLFWGEDSRCLYNDAYHRSIGPERHPGAVGRPAREVWAEIWDIIGPQIQQVMAGKGATWHENALVPITRHGRREEVYWTYSYSPVDDPAAPAGVGGVLVVTTEATEQVLFAKALKAAQDEATAANQAKSEFLANMSHEIRTPMNAVMGLSRLLALTSPLTPKQTQFVTTLHSSAESLLDLVNQLLDIAKIEARTVELENIPFSLSRLVQDVVAMIAIQAAAKRIELTGDAQCVEGRSFIGDPTRIRQIVTNLLSNAVKFTGAGAVRIVVNCRPTDAANLDLVDIAVSDSGIGIAPDRVGSIFSKFTQADSSITRKFGGTGLGLAISKSLAELMGGEISVESVPSQGSTFTFSLPMAYLDGAEAKDATTVADSIEATMDAQDRPKILLVEDDAASVLVATTYIRGFGYQVDVVDNGMAAFEKLRDTPYAAALMDVRLHGLDGLETTRLIRAHEAHYGRTPVRILGITALAYPDERDRCLAAGMDGYLSQPYEPGALRDKLMG